LALTIDATLPGWVLAWLGVSGGASLVAKTLSHGEPQDAVSAASARRDARVLVASGQFVAVK